MPCLELQRWDVLGAEHGGLGQLISTQGTWEGEVDRAERGGQAIFGSRPSIIANGNWRPLRTGNLYLLAGLQLA